MSDDPKEAVKEEFKQEDHNPEPDDRICEKCDPPVRLVWDIRVRSREYRCPKCGRYEEFLGKTQP